MTLDDSVHVLTSILRADCDARPVLFLGAGASFSSGVPLAAECVRRIGRRVFAERVKGRAIVPEQVKLSEWFPWLQQHSWFVSGEDRLADNFPLIVEHLLVPREYRKQVFLELLQPSSGIGPGYKALAELVLRGLLRTILTTNFDTCLPMALNEKWPHLRRFSEVNRSPGDLLEFDLFSKAQIVWLHGKAEQYSDRNLIDEVAHLDAQLVEKLLALLMYSPLIVVGYRGAEPSVMEDLLLGIRERTQSFRHGIFWCSRHGEALHPGVEALRRAVGTNFQQLEIRGFDELMESLSVSLSGEDTYANKAPDVVAREAIGFDDSPFPRATAQDLDLDLALVVLQEYCRTLRRAPVGPETLVALFRELGLFTNHNSIEVPTVGCVLIFGRRPQDFFPQAVVSVSVSGKKRIVFEGNLIVQRRDLLDWLESPEINPQLKVKRRAVYEQQLAYFPRVLVELLINQLVHRDYQIEQPATIEIEPNSSIVFSNPGGLPDAAAKRVDVDSDGRFRPVPQLSELRNRSICDVFFGYRAMERAGSGLADVEQLSMSNGGGATFNDLKTTREFRVKVTQPVASAASRGVVRDYRKTELYVLNVLPFAVLPDNISVAKLRISLRERPAEMSLANAGTFVTKGSELYSFVSSSILQQTFSAILDGPVAQTSRNDFVKEPERRRVLSWLLRHHFERHLTTLASTGLALERQGHGIRRAYFVGVDDRKPRTITYNSPKRKGIKRQVVKERKDRKKTFFENEGFGFEVVSMDDRWAIRIKPFYMFTERDAKTPLPSFARASHATRRIKFDRNKSVEDDLTFWARFLSAGSPTINLGQDHVEGLLLEATFLTFELPVI